MAPKAMTTDLEAARPPINRLSQPEALGGRLFASITLHDDG